MRSQSSGSDAAVNGGQTPSEATPLPVATQEILSRLNANAALGFSPAGDVAVVIQIVVPALTPGGSEYAGALASWAAARLLPAIIRASVFDGQELVDGDTAVGHLGNAAMIARHAAHVLLDLEETTAILGLPAPLAEIREDLYAIQRRLENATAAISPPANAPAVGIAIGTFAPPPRGPQS